jgi:hypothetical protein
VVNYIEIDPVNCLIFLKFRNYISFLDQNFIEVFTNIQEDLR